MKVCSRGSLGNEGMLKGFAGGMKVCSRGSLGNESMFKRFARNEGMFKGIAA